MKLNQKGAFDFTLAATVAIVVAVGGFVLIRMSDSLSADSAEMMVLREFEAELLPNDWISSSAIDEGCQEDLSINARFDRMGCKTRIFNVYSGETAHDDLLSDLENDPSWQVSESGEKFAKSHEGVDVCVSLSKARVDFETEDVNSWITVMTLLDDNCFTSFNSVEQQFSDRAGASLPFSNVHFDIDLPADWTEETLDPSNVTGVPEAYYSYSDSSGRSIAVSVNSLGFGGGGDGSASIEIEDNKFMFSQDFKACDPAADETGGCRYGDDKLFLIVSSASLDDGNSYLFWLRDDNSEELSAYQGLIELLDGLTLK